jgi:hypothetical protein
MISNPFQKTVHIGSTRISIIEGGVEGNQRVFQVEGNDVRHSRRLLQYAPLVRPTGPLAGAKTGACVPDVAGDKRDVRIWSSTRA